MQGQRLPVDRHQHRLTEPYENGSCSSGALAAGAVAAAGPALKDLNFGGRLVATSVLGGVASVAGGGKFANGALRRSGIYLMASGSIGRRIRRGIAARTGRGWKPDLRSERKS